MNKTENEGPSGETRQKKTNNDNNYYILSKSYLECYYHDQISGLEVSPCILLPMFP